MKIDVWLRVGTDNEQFLLGSFDPETRRMNDMITLVDNDKPLAALLRRAADVIEADGDFPI